MSSAALKKTATKKRDYEGRVFIFTSRKKNYKDQCQQAKNVIGEFGMETSDIKIDDKPYLSEIMCQLTNNRTDLPQVFFNQKHIGGLDDLIRLRDQQVLGSMIEEAKKEDPGVLYKLYRTQNDLFLISTPDLYFPPPYDRRIICVVRLINRTNKYAVYKLKTTSPKSFSVTPKQGYILPNQSEKLEITMSESDISELQSSKFRVEGILLKSGLEDMKSVVEDTFKKVDPKSIVKQAINIKFETPPDDIKVTQYNDGTVVVEEMNVPTSVAYELFPQVFATSSSQKKQSSVVDEDLSPQWLSHHDSESHGEMTSSGMFQSVIDHHHHHQQQQQQEQQSADAIMVTPRESSGSFAEKNQTTTTATTIVEQPVIVPSNAFDERARAVEINQQGVQSVVSIADQTAGYINVPTTHANVIPSDIVNDNYFETQRINEEAARLKMEQIERERLNNKRVEEERIAAQKKQEERELERQMALKLQLEQQKKEELKRQQELQKKKDEEDLLLISKIAQETKETVDQRVSHKSTEDSLKAIDEKEYNRLKEEYSNIVEELKNAVSTNKILEDRLESEVSKFKNRVKELENALAEEKLLRQKSNADKETTSAASVRKEQQPAEYNQDFLFAIIVALVAFILGWLM